MAATTDGAPLGRGQGGGWMYLNYRKPKEKTAASDRHRPPGPLGVLCASTSSGRLPLSSRARGASMAGFPSGAVTYLVGDVEASAALWEETTEAMRAALARHPDGSS